MADLTVFLTPVPYRGNHVFYSPIWRPGYEIDVESFPGIGTVATHQVCPVSDEFTVLHGWLIVDEAFVSGGPATIQVFAGPDALTGVIPVSALTAGAVFELSFSDADGTAGGRGAVDTLDWTVAGAEITAGRAFVQLELFRTRAVVVPTPTPTPSGTTPTPSGTTPTPSGTTPTPSGTTPTPSGTTPTPSGTTPTPTATPTPTELGAGYYCVRIYNWGLPGCTGTKTMSGSVSCQYVADPGLYPICNGLTSDELEGGPFDEDTCDGGCL